MEEEEELEVCVKVETPAGIYTAHRLLMDNAKSRMATWWPGAAFSKAVEVFDFDFQIIIRGGGLWFLLLQIYKH